MGFSDRGYSRDDHQPFLADWTAVMTIMVVNVAVWVLNLMAAGDFRVSEFLSLQGDLIRHPLKAWELVTYGFVHAPLDPWHLIGNMLMLWFFGREVEAIMGRGEFFRFYFTAIVLAGLAWLASVSLFGGRADAVAAHRLMGASGAIMAVFAVFVWYFPRQTVLLWFVLPVPVWALGLLYLVTDLQGATHGGGQVAHVAHLAGAVFGLCYAWRGWDLSGLGDMQDRLQTRLRGLRRGMRVVRPPEDDAAPPRRAAERDDVALQEAVDLILEKISRSGEASLTPAERDTLTQASRRLKERMR
ncbi:MAG: rhomboid family intramembrane serine protease [Planctomycetia bacterium]|nr:rhomboid family intramembrane serine protease [Planctomycetia bacterium]